jgi:hypothetical protein
MRKLKHSLTVLASPLLIAGMLLVAPTRSQSQGRVQQLPINAFLAAQAPTQTTIWADPNSSNVLVFDAFGKRNSALALNLGTTVAGQITIRDLGGGIERVTVLVNTRNALCWGFTGFPSPLVPAFGRNPAAVAGGAQASLGDGLTRLQFTEPKDSRLPSYNELSSGTPPYVLESVSTAIMCPDGELRAGSGFAEGTTGFAQTTQVGLLTTNVPSGCPQSDCFPAEKIQFKQTGQ